MLVVAIFTHKGYNTTSRPMYDRQSGEVAANQEGFDDDDVLMEVKPREGNHPYTLDSRGVPIRYTAERSEAFAR